MTPLPQSGARAHVFFASPQALTHVLLVIILDELAAASAGDQGPIVAAVREAVQRLVKQVFALFGRPSSRFDNSHGCKFFFAFDLPF
jgi:hypothetical protein